MWLLQPTTSLGHNSHLLVAGRSCRPAPWHLAQVFTSDDTQAWYKGRHEPPALSARRGHSGSTISRLNGCSSTPACHQTWKSPHSPVTVAYSMSKTQCIALHLILKWVINTNCCTTIAQKNMFFIYAQEKMRLIRRLNCNNPFTYWTAVAGYTLSLQA